MLKLSLLCQYENNYNDIDIINENNIRKIYTAYNNQQKRKCILKIINKAQLELGDYDFLIEQINREEEILKLCNSNHIIKFYQRFETNENIIFELEYCNIDLKEYIQKNGELSNDIEFFKIIIISLAKALKDIHEKGIMHRDIKPQNIFILEENNEKIIKLGDFGCSIFIKDNISDPIGTIFYSAPEILKNMEYDEKCDLWNLGITLYELYFGILPYGFNPSVYEIKKIIYNEKKFLFKQTKIPILDNLFQRLLVIDPKKRIDYNEFFEYVFRKIFIEKDIICQEGYKDKQIVINSAGGSSSSPFIENKTKENNIKNNLKGNININSFHLEKKLPKNGKEEEREIMLRIFNIVKEDKYLDIINIDKNFVNKESKYNNIIYYDENIKFLNNIYDDSADLERITPGAFILCTNMESLKLIREELLRQIKRDKKCIFNLITTGSKCEKIINFLKENKNFENCIKNICVYCFELNKWKSLKDNYKIIYNIYDNLNDIIDFIKKTSSKNIKPFPIIRLITYNDYLKKYKEKHFKISKYYGDLNKETFKKNIEKIKSIIKKDELKVSEKTLLKGLMTFDIKNDLDELDKLIINEYTKNTFYGDLNNWLMKPNYYESISYFTARLMYSLNSYAEKNKKYFNLNKKQIYRGVKMPYSCLLQYERAKHKIILLPSFTSTSRNISTAKNFAGRENTYSLYKANLYFSVIFNIINYYKKEWISNGINIQNEAEYSTEEEVLFQPFSFYYVKDIQINFKNYTAEIFLKTIGKVEILEEKIKFGKDIQFNKKIQIMETK